MLGEGLAAVAELDARLARWQLQRLLGGPYDEGDAVLSIQARRPWGTACSPAGWLFRAAGEASRPRSIAQRRPAPWQAGWTGAAAPSRAWVNRGACAVPARGATASAGWAGGTDAEGLRRERGARSGAPSRVFPACGHRCGSAAAPRGASRGPRHERAAPAARRLTGLWCLRRRALAARTRRTGRRCWSACTCAGRPRRACPRRRSSARQARAPMRRLRGRCRLAAVRPMLRDAGRQKVPGCPAAGLGAGVLQRPVACRRAGTRAGRPGSAVLARPGRA